MYLKTIQTLHKVWRWLKDQIAQDVPEEDGLCEYDCRKQQCTAEEWATCERRATKAAGELWPESGAPSVKHTQEAKTSPTAPESSENAGADYRPINIPRRA